MHDDRHSLDQALLAAHDTGDTAALVGLYTRAADLSVTDDARGFFLTQAYIFALDTGAAQTPTLRAELAAMGREANEDDT